MRIKSLFILLTMFSSSLYAETVLKVFANERIKLPESCSFIVRGGYENDFTCPSSTDPFRSITFPVLESFEESIPKRKDANSLAEEEGLDFYSEPVKQLVIDDKKHYLWVWHMHGKSHQSYTVCDYRSCVKVSAMEIDFVRAIMEQFSSKTIYDIE